jgi:Ni/Fe-hydrogenase subunit HybB-like protein
MSGPSNSRGLPAVLFILLGIGVIAFVVELSSGGAVRGWSVYLVNLLFWSGIAAAGPAIAGIMELTEAKWGKGVKRIAAMGASFFPVSFVLFLILFGGREVLYPWVATPLPKKAVWLNVPFMSLRIGVGVLLLYLVSAAFARAVLREGVGSEAERERQKERRVRLAVVMLILYVVVLSLVGFDLVMSLEPKWYSGLFGGFYVVGTFYSGFALLAFLSALLGRGGRPGLRVSPSELQDVSKLVFATSILWMYFFWSQYLVIWYGNIPIEVGYLIKRLIADPWRFLSIGVAVIGWGVPFCYLLSRLTGKPPERTKDMLVISSLSLIAIWLERFVLVLPATWHDQSVPFGLSELLITAGFFALFVLSYRRSPALTHTPDRRPNT